MENTLERRLITSEEFCNLLQNNKVVSNLLIKGKVLISDSTFNKTNKVEIFNCKFIDEFDLKTSHIKIVNFRGCEFNHRLLLLGNYQRINISKSTFRTYFTSKNLSCLTFTIDENVVENFKLTQLQEFTSETLYFRNNYFTNDILIKPEKLRKLVIEGSEKHYLISYSGQDIDSPLESLTLFSYSNFRTDYLIRSFKAEELQLIGELKDSILTINNCYINHGIIHGFINQGTLIFNGIKNLSKSSVLIIKTSLLGKAQINNIDFTTFKKVVLESSNLLEISPVNVLWCKNLNIESKDLESQKENYRQLKIVSTKNEDIESKLFFYKLEMQTLLRLNKKIKHEVNDRFILQTNFLSNDFGHSWLKAFCWILGSSILFYTLIKYLLGYRYFDSEFIVEDSGKLLLFINPLHQFEKVFDTPSLSNTNGALLVDGIFKLIIAYLIFQFISSFRKYSFK